MPRGSDTNYLIGRRVIPFAFPLNLITASRRMRQLCKLPRGQSLDMLIVRSSKLTKVNNNAILNFILETKTDCRKYNILFNFFTTIYNNIMDVWNNTSLYYYNGFPLHKFEANSKYLIFTTQQQLFKWTLHIFLTYV